MIITLSGLPGSGKSSVAKILAQKLGYAFYSAGNEARKKAKALGISPTEFLDDPTRVTSLDQGVSALSKKKNIVVDARLSAYLLPRADFRIFLYAPLTLRSVRIADRENISFLTSFFRTWKRQRHEIVTYRRAYHVDFRNKKFYNIVFCTKGHTAKETADELLWRINRGKK